MTKRNDDTGRYIGVTFDPDWKPRSVAKMPDFPGAYTAHPLAPIRRTPRPPGWTRLDEMLRRIDDVTAEPVPFKETAVNLNGQAADSSLTPQPELTAAELAALGRRLDERDFAAALGDSYARLGVPRPVAPATRVVPFGPPLVSLVPSPEREWRRLLAKHEHIWTTTSPMRCVECRHYLTPWWRRVRDRIRRRAR